jgi:hypothetical protein|tara:strand:- start:318 stop:1025 length:708 start_codon:yes stop_codon:yes gene_type:complete
MALPKIDQPLFEIVIPSTDKKAHFRPFTVKEEKILLIAQESKDVDQIILSIKQVLNNCLVGAEVDDLSVFDLEYIILNIRGKSVNNEILFGFQDEETEERVDVMLNVNDVNVQFDPNHSKEIVINDQYYIMMRYPSLDEVKGMQLLGEGDTEQMFNTMLSCIDILVDRTSDEIYKLSEFTDKEVSDFVDGFTGTVVESIKKFYQTMPKLRHTIEYKDKNGKDKTFVVEGMESFFT